MMNMVAKQISLAHHINAPGEAVTIDAIRISDNGAVLWEVFDKTVGECRYVLEGETGEYMEAIESIENAIDEWEKF